VLLYNSSISGNCYKVRLVAAHLGIPLELQEVQVIDRTDTRPFLADLNPARRVPTLVLDDGRPLAESGAIIWYLAEGSRFIPEDAYLRAQVLQWMLFEQYEHEPAIAVARFVLTYSGHADELADLIARKQKDGVKALAMMESHLAARDWFVGDSMTLADVVLYAYTHVADEGGFDLEPYPAIRGWLARVAAEPGHITIDS
jgi:glutathione S-transferase